MWVEITTAVVGLLALILVVGARTVSAGKVQVQLSDVLIAAIVCVVVLLLTGRISKLGLSTTGVNIEVAEAFRSAAERKISAQVSPLPMQPLEVLGKGSFEPNPAFVRRQIPGLSFKLAGGSYVAEAIREHLETLTKYPFFRFVIILKPDGKLFGMIDARKLLRVLQEQEAGWSFSDFEMLINRGDAEAQARLSSLPGFVSEAKGLQPDSDKLEALEKMDALHMDWLPVVSAGELKGIVERSALTASMLVDVARQLRSGQNK